IISSTMGSTERGFFVFKSIKGKFCVNFLHLPLRCESHMRSLPQNRSNTSLPNCNAASFMYCRDLSLHFSSSLIALVEHWVLLLMKLIEICGETKQKKTL